MDKRLKRVEKKLHRAQEELLDDDTRERRRMEKRLAGLKQHEKDINRHLVKEGLKEAHAKSSAAVKATSEAFHRDNSALDSKIVAATYGLVTLDELKQKKKEVMEEEAKLKLTEGERKKRDEEEAKQRRVDEREKMIQKQKASLSFDIDDV
jgi:hypothetical protein